MVSGNCGENVKTQWMQSGDYGDALHLKITTAVTINQSPRRKLFPGFNHLRQLRL
jgi:hypothetical protein